MASDERDRELSRFVEEFATLLDRFGLPRMAGRLLGWLLICNPADQSTGDLARAFQASKGSISTMTRMLVQMGLVERFNVSGSREFHFRLRSDAWGQLLEQRAAEIANIRKLAVRGLTLLGEDSPARERLAAMNDAYAFFERELPALVQRWERERASL